MKFKTWHIIAVVGGLGLSGLMAYDMFQPDELDLRIEKRRAEALHSVQTKSKEVNVGKVKEVSGVLPPRVLNAPTYDRLLMAARIENEAVDQNASKGFIQLTTNRRNARLAAEVARYRAESKKYEADFEEAIARIKASREGKLSIESVEMTQIRTNSAVEALAEGEVDKKPDNAISLRTFDDVTNEMMIKVGERWFTSVKSGQTIDGFLVGLVDSTLKCVPLTKNDEVQVICLN